MANRHIGDLGLYLPALKMALEKKDKSKGQILLVPDRAVQSFVERALGQRNIELKESICLSRGFAVRALRAVDATPTQLLLIPSPKLGKEQLSVARATVAGGGSVVAWSASPSCTTPEESEQWLVEQLLAQIGSQLVLSFASFVEAARIFSRLGPPGNRHLTVKGPKNELTARIKAMISKTQTGKGQVATNEGPRWAFIIDKEGQIHLQAARDKKLEVSEPGVTLEALDGYFESSPVAEVPTTAVVKPNRNLVENIVRPPGRLLSETTSKRLMTAYGIAIPREKLCKSASEAVRFLKIVEDKAVFKLVRPKLENKQEKGAVITDVVNPAMARKSVHSLESLAQKLGPPSPLGILVAEQIQGGTRIWARLRDHEQFGRLLLVGPGDSKTTIPNLALAVPATPVKIRRALLMSGIFHDENELELLVTPLVKFSAMLEDLGPRIDRAEIHPLVAMKETRTALALDALVSIAGVGVGASFEIDS